MQPAAFYISLLWIFAFFCSSKEAGTSNESCGTWQNSHKFLHQAILDRRIPAKFLISVPVRQGLADNLTGMVSQFLFALLTNRAFLRLSYKEAIPLEKIFTPAQISWNKCNIPSTLVSSVMPPYPKYATPSLRCLQPNGTKLKWNGMSVCPLQMVNSNSTHVAFRDYNLSNILSGKDDSFQVIAIAGNRGSSIQLFKNPLYADYLKEIGLRPETIFSCIFNYHFRL